MAWKDLSYDKKVTLTGLVSAACTAHNIAVITSDRTDT